MNDLEGNGNRMNRRVEVSPLERKLEEIGRDANKNEADRQMKSPLERKLQDLGRHSVVDGDGKKKDVKKENEQTKSHTSKPQRIRRRASGSAKRVTNLKTNENKAVSRRAKEDSVLELLELLRSSSDAIKNGEVNRRAPQRSYSDEVNPGSKKEKRSSVSFRMEPKLKHQLSMGDLYDGTKPKKERSRKGKGKKKELRCREAETSADNVDQESKQSSSSGDLQNGNQTNSRKERDHKEKKESRKFWAHNYDFNFESSERCNPNFDSDDVSSSDDDARKHGNVARYLRRGRREEQRASEDSTHSESSSSHNPTREPQGRWHPSDESIDENSFLQDAPSTLGDFHDRKHSYLRRSKSASSKADEQKPERPKSLERSSSDGHMFQSSSSTASESNTSESNTSESKTEEDEKAKQRRRRRSAGGKVRNNRTQEEYIGFFLTSSTEENLKHGYGITKFPDGRVFEGVYEEGKMVEGKMTYPAAPSDEASALAVVAATFQNKDQSQSLGSAGATYVGKFDEDGLRCGKGIYTTAESTFLGQFRQDQQHGSGILIFHDGADTSLSRRFIGHWKEGLRHGFGRELLADGTVEREGLWEKGRFTGAVASPRKF